MTKLIFLIRHAAPQDGTGIRYDVPPGPGLSASGKREAREMAEFLANRGITRILYSPLDRTTQTAQILADRLGLEPIAEDAIREMRKDETADGVRERMKVFWEQEMARPEEAIAIVSHGGPLRYLIEWLTDGREKFNGYRFAGGNVIPTAGVWQVRPAFFGMWEALFVFQPNIMPETQPTPAWAAGGQVV